MGEKAYFYCKACGDPGERKTSKVPADLRRALRAWMPLAEHLNMPPYDDKT